MPSSVASGTPSIITSWDVIVIFFSFVSFWNSNTFLPLYWNTWLWQKSTTCICFHLQRNQPDTGSASFPYRTAVFIFVAQYWGTNDLLFAVLGTVWSPMLQYWSMHGCLSALLWYKLSFLNLCRVWRRLEAVASLLMIFEVYWDMMPCTDISETLHFQISNSLRRVNCIEWVVCVVGGSRLLQNVCNISPFYTSPYSRRLDIWARFSSNAENKWKLYLWYTVEHSLLWSGM